MAWGLWKEKKGAYFKVGTIAQVILQFKRERDREIGLAQRFSCEKNKIVAFPMGPQVKDFNVISNLYLERKRAVVIKSYRPVKSMYVEYHSRPADGCSLHVKVP